MCHPASHPRLSSFEMGPPPSFPLPLPPAGNQLFHVVVESDDVAMRCSELLVQYKQGRVSFMPLNTINPAQVRAMPKV